MASATRVTIPRTYIQHWPLSTPRGTVDLDVPVQMTIWLAPSHQTASILRRAESLGASQLRLRHYEERTALESATTASQDELARVCRYCERYRLEVTDARWCCVEARGPLGRFIDAFGADVAIFEDSLGRQFRSRAGSLVADADIARLVRGVFGFSQWPKARRLGSLQRHVDPLRIDEIVARYHFPDASGADETIGIIQMGGDVRLDDFERCMRAQGIEHTPPDVVRFDDPARAHQIATSQDLEAALDAQIAGALAPQAHVAIYRGPDSERAFLDAVRRAIFDKERAPSILTISYGWPEMLWTPGAIDILNELFAIAALAGISIFCASGDNGAELDYDGKPHVLFPASSPFVHACGATAIADHAREIAWARTGGGFSESFDTPAWQRTSRAANSPSGRGVPDVSAQESPGYCVYLEQTELAAGGTSAVAPMWAALTARINERLGGRAGFFAPLLYESGTVLDPIVDGTNGYYAAGPRWNPCVGLGIPNGTRLEALLRA